MNTDRDSVRSSVGPVLGGVNDTGSEEETDGDTELVSRDDGSSDLSGCDFRHVENDDGGNESDSDTRDQSSSNDLKVSKKEDWSTANTHETETVGRGGLENVSNAEDSTSRDDGPSSTDPICQITSDEGTEESTS